MSHFSVMVITPTLPNDEELALIMQPWHEYESTGILDEYVQQIDITEEAMKEYLKYETTFLLNMKTYDYEDWYGADGSFRKGFYEVDEYNRKTQKTPKGYKEVTKLYREVKSFEDFLKYWYGATTSPSNSNYYTISELGSVGKVFKRTNPNAKWDWWQIGGRWSGMLEVGYDPKTDPANMENCFLCGGTGQRDDDIGKAQRAIDPNYMCNGCDGKGVRSKWPTGWVNRGNQIQVGKLDLSSIRDSKAIEAGNDYDRFYSLIGIIHCQTGMN